MMSQRIHKLPLGWLIFVLAVICRVVYLVSLQNTPSHIFLSHDSFLFDHYARLWANGTIQTVVGSNVIPVPSLYIIFLGFIYRVFGYNPLIPQMIQMILGALSCVLIYRIGKRSWNREVGFFAGVIAAFSGILIFYDLEILKLSLTNVLFLTAFYSLISKRRVGFVGVCLSAVALSLAVLLREQLLILIPVIVLWIAFCQIKEKKVKTCFLALVFLVVCLLSPPLVNKGLSLALPKYSDFAATGGIHFYIGNNPKATGAYATAPGISPLPKGHYYDAQEIAEKDLGRPLTRREVNRFWYQKSWDYIRQNPQVWFRLELRKLFLILNEYEIPNDENYPHARDTSWFLKLPLFSYGIICPLALLGFILQLRKNCSVPNLLIYSAAAYAVILMLTFVTGAYRLPLQTLFILFAAFSVFVMKELLRTKRILRFVLVLTVLVPLYLVSNIPTYLSQKDYEDKIKKRYEFLEKVKGREAESLYRLLSS